MSGAAPERVFLGWDKPLLEGLKGYLLGDPLGLPRTLVVVPTSNSGRRLRLLLSEQGGGVISPHVMPPSRLFQAEGYASPSQTLWAWVRTLQGVDVADFPHLFPNHTEGALSSFRTSLSISKRLIRMRDQLADADKGFVDAGRASPEKDRWKELCRLEARYSELLKSWSLADPVMGKRRRAADPELPPGVDRIVVAGVPDPSLLALKALQKHAANGVQVSVLVHAPKSDAEGFDEWGLPLEDFWNEKVLEVSEWESRLHVVDDARQAAGKVVSLYAGAKTGSDQAALGLCDASLAAALEKELGEAGWDVFNPDGRSVVDSGLVRLIACSVNLASEVAPFDALRELVRIPGAELFLPDDVSRGWAAKLMDDLDHAHLPETVDDALHLADGDARVVVESVVKVLDDLSDGKIDEVLKRWLSAWLGRADKEVAKAAEPVLAEVLDGMSHLVGKGEAVSAKEVFEMLQVGMGSLRLTERQVGTVLDMQGWLELSHDPAQHLVLAGMHEGCVPDGTGDDEFLPDTLKRNLGMRDGAGRSARDAFLFQSMLKCRETQQGGRVDVVVTRFNDVGEACKPSRLLMRAGQGELASVVKHLFSEGEAGGNLAGPWKRDWVLRLPECENPYAGSPPKALSPSAIKGYLDCPLRFYLRQVAKMEAFEMAKREMDALDFGNLCHGVLEEFGNDVAICHSVDAKEIEEYLSDVLDARVTKLYGKKVGLPIIVQLESARERFKAFAHHQAARRAEGWKIVHSELRVGYEEEADWTLAGHPVRMIIDRIDYNEESGQWAVWDYKTTGVGHDPEEQHLKPWKEAENRVQLGDLYPRKSKQSKSDRRWADVQLPLYAGFVRERFSGGEIPEVGYVNLPRALSGVGFKRWEKFGEVQLESALVWASAAIDGIRAGEFDRAAEYPASERGWDNFSELAPDGLAEAFGLNPD